MADALFPPPAKRFPLPVRGEDTDTFLLRLVSFLNDFYDADLTFVAGVTVAVVHSLGRIPSAFELTYVDAQTTIYAVPSSGWGSKVVYFVSDADCHARIRLS